MSATRTIANQDFIARATYEKRQQPATTRGETDCSAMRSAGDNRRTSGAERSRDWRLYLIPPPPPTPPPPPPPPPGGGGGGRPPRPGGGLAPPPLPGRGRGVGGGGWSLPPPPPA